ATVGEEVGFSPVISGEADNLQFNYAWRRGDGWDEWNSTVKETGEMTSETSGHFTPAKAGVYYVWVDAQDDMGRKQTSDMYELRVEPRDEDKWTLESVTASGAKVVGKPVEFSAVITGKTEGLSYNYAWSFGDGWEHWSSTMKETGAMTQETHGTFTPDRAGIYNVWIDVEDEFGIRVTSDVLPVEIDAAPITWTLEGVDAPSSGSVGEPLSFSAQVSGETDGLRYNYAWSYEGLWGDNWSSTRLRTGDYTSELSDTFTPDKVGTYYLWVDVTDGYRVETSEQLAVSVAAAPEPQPAWTLVDVDAPEIGTAGEELGFSAVIEGDATGLMFSYAWAAGESGWDEWSSTKKENDGAMTTETTGHFTPEHSGIYRVWLDVQDAQGNQTTSATKFITVSDE
ncbi:MAG: PKD domain-containing protein, partial [Coriobacteriales bacterium]|nr:PKD domain-containing protein [Coriobacteriales bacterium]